MLSPLWALLLAGWFAADAKDDARKALDPLQGKWKLTRLEIDGRPGPKDALNATIAITGDKLILTLKGPGGKEEKKSLTLRLDATKSPGHIDMKPEGPPTKDDTSLGIYELKGNTLRICGSDPPRSKDRPTSFEAKKGDHRVLFILEGVK